MNNVAILGGDVTGEVVALAADKALTVRTKTPFSAKGVSMKRFDKTEAHDLDLSLSLISVYTPAGWKLSWAPFTISTAGRRLASIEGDALLPSKEGLAGTITGSWNVDLKALASQTAIPGMSWITARSASGEFSAKQGNVTRVEGKLAVLGPETDHSITANFDADIGYNREISFHAPIKISLGSNVSEISAAGSWSMAEAGTQVSAMLKSPSTTLEHLRELAAPLAALGGTPITSGSTAEGSGTVRRDSFPFWGHLTGHVTLGFDHLKAWGDDMKEVRGIIAVDHKSLSVDNATWEQPDKTLVMWKGSISFDPAAEHPYSLNASADLGEVDGALVFGPTPAGKDPVFRGRLSIAKTLKGNGANFNDLTHHIEEEFQLTNKGSGIIRFLKMNVAESLPEPPTTREAAILGTMGDVVRPIFGSKSGVIKVQQNHLAKNTEAVLNFSYDLAEFRYDLLTIKAARGADHILHLVEIEMVAPDEHMTGSGWINSSKDQSLSSSALSLDIQFGAKGRVAEFLSVAGLLSPQKDDKGYTLLVQPLHLGGTLQNIDKNQLLALLVKAATSKQEKGKTEDHAIAGKK